MNSTSNLVEIFTTIAKIGLNGSASFNVEEYKRPTFEVTFDEYKEAIAKYGTIPHAAPRIAAITGKIIPPICFFIIYPYLGIGITGMWVHICMKVM